MLPKIQITNLKIKTVIGYKKEAGPLQCMQRQGPLAAGDPVLVPENREE